MIYKHIIIPYPKDYRFNPFGDLCFLEIQMVKLFGWLVIKKRYLRFGKTRTQRLSLFDYFLAVETIAWSRQIRDTCSCNEK